MTVTLDDILPDIVTIMQGIAGVKLVVKDIVEPLPDASTELPAIYLEAKSPTITKANFSSRLFTWPIDINVFTAYRSGDGGADMSGIHGYPEKVVAALDAARTLNGKLQQVPEYGEPAVSAPGVDGAFGYVEWKERVLAMTTIHAIFKIKRVGGF